MRNISIFCQEEIEEERMTTTKTLIEAATLTEEEEKHAFYDVPSEGQGPYWNPAVGTSIATVARDKALWAMVDWLKEGFAEIYVEGNYPKSFQDDREDAGARLRRKLLAAGIKRPAVV